MYSFQRLNSLHLGLCFSDSENLISWVAIPPELEMLLNCLALKMETISCFFFFFAISMYQWSTLLNLIIFGL